MRNFQKYLFFMLLGAGFIAVSTAFALSKDDIVFPVAELNNCATEQECRSYCDDSANIEQCVDFAEKYNLLSENEIQKAKKFREIGAVGPGGCASERECEAYCENVNNIEECLAFAETHGFLEDDELDEARKIAAALQSGAQLPGGCTGKSSCEAYCSDLSHMRECIAFAEQAGFMSERELKEAKQVLKALDAGLKMPGGCTGERQCDAYCASPDHAEECIEFALAAGFIPPEEAEEVKRILPLMKSGKMPQACRGGKEACEAYCSQEQNADECTTFFIEAGFMTAEEAEMFRKTGGKGPGGCKGEQECNDFCNNPNNQEACFAFATEHGLIPEEELANIKEGIGRFRDEISQAPPEVAQCLQDRIGAEKLAKIEAGTLLPNPQLGDIMRTCFEEFFPRDNFEGRDQGSGLPGGFGEGISAEQQDCIQRILGSQNFQGPPPPDVEARIGQECFRPDEQQFGPHETGDFPQPQEFERQFEQEFQQEFQQQFQQEFQGEFEQRFGEERQRIEEQFAPSDFQTGGGPSPEDIQRIEQQEAAALQQQQVQQQQLEQELLQQFQELEQLQQQLQQETAPSGGSALDAFLYLLRPLLPR